jgi:hypothetical protein
MSILFRFRSSRVPEPGNVVDDTQREDDAVVDGEDMVSHSTPLPLDREKGQTLRICLADRKLDNTTVLEVSRSVIPIPNRMPLAIVVSCAINSSAITQHVLRLLSYHSSILFPHTSPYINSRLSFRSVRLSHIIKLSERMQSTASLSSW